MDERASILVTLFNPTGGWLYHLRALRYRNTLWMPFRQQVAQFLKEWQPREKQLLILGPSGGHTLPTDFLQGFEKLWLFDPDRFAPVFFQKNHPGLAPQWSRTDLIFHRKKFDAEKLNHWLEGQNIAVLFSNLLGQLPLIGGLEPMHAWWKTVLPSLNRHSWASYHDLFSFPEAAKLPPRLPDGAIVPQLVEWSMEKNKSLELIDHGTSELFANSPAWCWNISSKQTHVVGGAFHRS